MTVGTADTYSISLVGVDGKVVASAQPSSPAQVTCGGGAAAVLPPPVSTSDTRAYFLDQQGNVNFLAPNGETGHSTRVPSGGQTRSMFAVSPDDRRIAVIQDTYTATGATTVLYIEDLNGGTNHLNLFSETGAFTLWPIGWHGTNNLVLAKVATCAQGGGPYCCGPLELHVVDPTTAVRRLTLGGPQCIIAGPASPAGVACVTSPGLGVTRVLTWTDPIGYKLPITSPSAAFLSPGGGSLATVTDIGAQIFPLGGTGTERTIAGLTACGWIDDAHLIAGGDTQQQARVGDITTGNIVPVAAQGICGGRIPGGL